MSDDLIHDGLHLIPPHMHRAVTEWIQHAQPHPSQFGHFFAAIMSNRFIEAVFAADEKNSAALLGWAHFLYNYAPSACYGSPEKLDAWYARHHGELSGP